MSAQRTAPDVPAAAGLCAAVRKAFLIRRAEQRLLQMYAEGKLFGTVHTCIGQEFAAVAVGQALKEEDFIFSNHRGHGHFLASVGTVAELFAEVMGKKAGICRGRGGSQHLQKGRYFSNGIQGGIVPVTLGLAYGEKLRGGSGIAVVFLGDGTLGEGVVYESFNIASKWALPVLFVCENNYFAQSTSQEQTLAGDICARAAAFEIDTRHGTTYDWRALCESMGESVAQVRSKRRPLFFQVDTFRLMAHSKGDDNRPAEYVQKHWDIDPLTIMERQWTGTPEWRDLTAAIDQELADAEEIADRSPFDTLPAPGPARSPVEWNALSFDDEKCVTSIRNALEHALRSNPRVIVLGEDVESPYGGAFKCTAGLSANFPERVRNVPISEAALVGLGNGLALGGHMPVVEIMFGDFCTLAMDQWVNHAGKFHFMYAGKVDVPLVIRTPMGGKRGYGATHSQSLERHLVGVPHTQVICLHHRYPPRRLFEELLTRNGLPTLVIENKALYGRNVSSMPPAGFSLMATNDPFPIVRLSGSPQPMITIVAIGGMAVEAEQALNQLFDEDDIIGDLFMPTRLYPFDIAPLLPSIQKSGRLIIVEEGQGFAAIGAEVISQAVEALSGSGLIVERVAAMPCAIPAARPLEAECLPDVARVRAAAVRLVHAGRGRQS